MSEPDLLTVDETAAYLRVDPKTVYRLINSNELPASLIGRVYRIRRSDMENFLQRSRIKVQSAPRKRY